MKNNEMVVIFTILAQALFILIITNIILTSSDIASLKKWLPLVNLLILAVVFLNLYSIKTLKETAEERIQARYLSEHLNQMELLLKNLNTERHEYARHLQAIQAMAYLGRLEELNAYINGIARYYRSNDCVIYTGHPSTSGLLNAKYVTAASKGINLAVAIKCDMKKIAIPPWDLCTVLGNLIDNAMEAAVKDPMPRVGVEIKQELGQHIIYVVNNGEQIKSEDIGRIFEAGYSTKSSLSKGYGLYLVKRIVDHYEGDITVLSGKKTAIEIKIPEKEEESDRKPFQVYSELPGE